MQIIDINGNTRECTSAIPDKDFPGYMKITYESKNRKGYTHFEWYETIEFVRNNPGLATLTKDAPKSAKEDLGVVGKGGKDFIQDFSKSWPEDIYKNYPVWISRGKGEGQQRTITKNNKNTAFIDNPWETVPDKSSQYVISFNVKEGIKATGNILPGVDTQKIFEKMITKAKKSMVN